MLADSLVPDSSHILRLIVALALGGAIGLERELRDKPAGFRTIILICVGACLFTIVSQAVAGPSVDPTRIAAQIVTGIGFLGAGAILHARGSVMGLTTASTVWATAAIGMAVGFGHLGLAAVGSGVILTALWLLDIFERQIEQRRDIQEYLIAAENTAGSFARIVEMFPAAGLSIRRRSFYQEDGRLVVHILAMGTLADHERLRLTLISVPEFTLQRS
jgi:putative Mg2+ transporter-C (MgtC) family protein